MEEANVEFVDPPKARRPYKKERYKGSLEVLMGNPKRWGRIDTFDDPDRANSARSNLKWAIRLKRYKFPEGHEAFQWTFSVQKDEDKGTWGLYARAWPMKEHLPEEA